MQGETDDDQQPISREERAAWPPEVEEYAWALWADPTNEGMPVGEYRARVRRFARTRPEPRQGDE